MSHIRKQIRDAIVAVLTGLTTTGSRVYKSRIYPLESGKLPGLCVFTKAETISNETITPPRTQIRVIEAMVEIYVMANSNIDDSLDTVSLEVEEAIYSNQTLGGLAKGIDIVSFDADYSGDGEKVVGVGRLSLEVTYTTKENDLESVG
jgi:hypothetical protein